MDKIDRKIVNILQTNARASLKDLSKECSEYKDKILSFAEVQVELE